MLVVYSIRWTKCSHLRQNHHLRTFSTKNSKVYHHNGLICVDTFAHGGGCLKAIQVSQMRIYQAYVNGNVQHFDLTKL